MSSEPLPNEEDVCELEAAIDQAIEACGGNLRETIRALIVANNFLESEVAELMKAISRAYVRAGNFRRWWDVLDNEKAMKPTLISNYTQSIKH
jgi:hypothetical protein